MRGVRVKLEYLPNGHGFHFPGFRGVKIGGNFSEVTVTAIREGSIVPSTFRWAPATEVIADHTVDVSMPTAEESDSLVCECGKTCTSKSGLTLHLKSCRHVPVAE